MDAVEAASPSQQAVGKVTNRLGLVTCPAVSVGVVVMLWVPLGFGGRCGLMWVWLRVEGRLVDGCRLELMECQF